MKSYYVLQRGSLYVYERDNYDKPLENKEVAIIYANRAATMEITGPYHSVLQDVELAFKYGYPKEMFFKVRLTKL